MRYVLMTAAKNEAAFIERPLEAVVRQTVLPLRWIIVSDGSMDDTDRIVKRYASRHPFIEFIRREGIAKREFGSKSMAIQQAYERVKELSFDYVGNLDADISFGPSYYEQTLGFLEQNPKTGLVTGRRYDRCGRKFKPMPPNMITGAVQLFRRQCWEKIGGYLTLRYGGEDTVAALMVAMKGWKVECLEEAEVFHHRETGIGQGGFYRRHLNEGAQAHATGYHPVFYLAMMVRDAVLRATPFGNASSLLGYAIAACKAQDRVVPEELVRYVRRDQMQKLGNRFSARRDRIGIPGRSVDPCKSQ